MCDLCVLHVVGECCTQSSPEHHDKPHNKRKDVIGVGVPPVAVHFSLFSHVQCGAYTSADDRKWQGSWER